MQMLRKIFVWSGILHTHSKSDYCVHHTHHHGFIAWIHRLMRTCVPPYVILNRPQSAPCFSFACIYDALKNISMYQTWSGCQTGISTWPATSMQVLCRLYQRISTHHKFRTCKTWHEQDGYPIASGAANDSKVHLCPTQTTDCGWGVVNTCPA